MAMEDKDYDGALGYLEECEFEDVMLGTIVIGLKGDCYVEKGDYETALTFFLEASEREPNDFTSPMFLKKAGLVYEKLEQRDKAVEVYQKIKDTYHRSTEAQDIDKYIIRAQN
jgi:tetratricopeptide (TPR) repeat protein